MVKRSKESVPTGDALQTGALAAEEPAVETGAIVPSVEPPAAPPASTGPSLGQRVRRFVRFLFTLILILLLLGGIGVGLYFGLPFVYEKYVLPVQQNTAQMAGLQTQQAQSEQAIADLQSKLSEVEAAQNEQAKVLSDLDARVSDLEKEIAAHTQTLAALDEMQKSLAEQGKSANAELNRQVNLLKAMELLSRARLFMYQSNFGLAKVDAQTARDILAEMQPTVPEPLATELKEVLLRLDLTLSNLPSFPVAASDDLDIAWQVLLSGLPPVEATPTPTAIP
jgi:cell division protein FtsB